MNNVQDISLYTMLQVFRKWWKTLLLFPLIAAALALLTTLFLPKSYYASTTVLPVNSVLGDRSRLFNDNIQALYSSFGTSDDLDRLYTIATAGTLLDFITDSLRLAQHYGITGTGEMARANATKQLKKNITIAKTANGALEVEAWDKDAVTAAAIANLVIYRSENLYKQFSIDLNQRIIDALHNDSETKRLYLHTPSVIDTTELRVRQRIIDQVERNEKLIDELKLTMQTTQPPLVVLEKAFPALKAGKPKVLLAVLTTFMFALFFTALCTLVIERNRSHEPAYPAT